MRTLYPKRPLLVIGLLLGAAGVWVVAETRPEPSAPRESLTIELRGVAPTTRFLAEPPDEADEADEAVEPRRLPPPPEPPGPDAGKDALWSYGESYLGWTPIDDEELAEYSAQEVSSWVAQDLRLQRLGRREPGGLGYLNYVEIDAGRER